MQIDPTEKYGPTPRALVTVGPGYNDSDYTAPDAFAIVCHPVWSLVLVDVIFDAGVWGVAPTRRADVIASRSGQRAYYGDTAARIRPTGHIMISSRLPVGTFLAHRLGQPARYSTRLGLT